MTNRGPKRQRPLVALLLGLLMSATLSAPALAADDPAEPADDNQPAIVLRLSPAVLEVAHGSGPSRHELRVENLGSQSVTVVTQLSDFTVTEDGTTQFLGPDELSAVAWATLDVDSFELAPGDRRDVILTVEVPDNAEAGERYLSAIFAVPGNPDGVGNITVTHRVAVKLYIAVPGERIELLELGELSGPRLIDTGPATFELTVHNRGNVHRRFEGDTQLLAAAGDNGFAFENFAILGGSSRVVEAVWPEPPLLCWCTIEVEVDDGRGNLLAVSTRVIAFPLRMSLALLALTVGLAIVAIERRRRRTSRLVQQLEAARREGANTNSAPDQGPQPPSPPINPPAQHRERVTCPPPTAPPPPTAAVTSEQPVHSTKTATVERARSAPQATHTPPHDTMTFTAHGTHGRWRRRRR
jgi:hypothetical protein